MSPKTFFPLSKSLFIIFVSTLIVSGPAILGWFFYLHTLKERAKNDTYNIVAIVQSAKGRETLKSLYIEEILNLSINHPMNLYCFNLKEAERTLAKSPVIKEVKLDLWPPGTLHVEYSLRSPIAYLYDYQNAAIDEEGVIFPIAPFFTPKNLPEIYLGKENISSWGTQLQGKSIELAMELLHFFSMPEQQKTLNVSRIDLSFAFSENSGQRQIILVLRDRSDNNRKLGGERTLRLNASNYVREINNYLLLRECLLKKEQEMIIDFRLPQLAFIKPQL